MNGYIKCPDCGLDIPSDATVCPYCAKNFKGKNRNRAVRDAFTLSSIFYYLSAIFVDPVV